MSKSERDRFVEGLRVALQRERSTRRLYQALAERETNEARRNALLGLARTEWASGRLDSALRQGWQSWSCGRCPLFALAESYPDLKANQSFLQLQSRISEIENPRTAAATK